MRSVLAFNLFSLVTVGTALRIVSLNPGFASSGRTGCITASSNTSNAAVVIQDCNASNLGQDWSFTALPGGNITPQPLRVLGDKCLDVVDGVDADGTRLQIFTCVPGNTNQLWLALGDNTFQWAFKDKCIDLTDGNVANGNQLQVFTCDSHNSNQVWSIQSVSPTAPVRLLAGGGGVPLPSVCLASTALNTDGTTMTLASCTDPSAINWIVPAAGTGQIKTPDGTRCLDVRDGNSTNGTPLQIWACTGGNTNQVFNFASSGLITWAGQTKCADVRDGIFAPGTIVQIWECDSLNTNQQWTSL